MSGQVKLSEIFYIHPGSLGADPSLASLSTVKKDILRDGFDSKHPIIIRLEGDKRIADGNHRAAVAIELKLDYVPVRFEYISTIEDEETNRLVKNLIIEYGETWVKKRKEL
jgi:hypothetical protein